MYHSALGSPGPLSSVEVPENEDQVAAARAGGAASADGLQAATGEKAVKCDPFVYVHVYI